MSTVVAERTRPKPKLLAPGWYRAALGMVIAGAFGFGLDVLIRAL